VIIRQRRRITLPGADRRHRPHLGHCCIKPLALGSNPNQAQSTYSDPMEAPDATILPTTKVSFRSCFRDGSACTDCFAGAVTNPFNAWVNHKFIHRKERKTEYTGSQVCRQWDLCKFQGPDGEKTRDVLRTPKRGNRTLSGRHL
jgi:hypothetical protein